MIAIAINVGAKNSQAIQVRDLKGFFPPAPEE